MPSYSDEQSKKYGLLAKYQKIIDYQLSSKQNDASQLGYQLTTTNKTNINQTVVSPNTQLIPLKQISPEAGYTNQLPQQGQQFWIHPSPTDSYASKDFSTSVGVAVEDPYLDSLLQSALSSDVQQRAFFYDQIDLVFSNDPSAYQARENLLQGAFGQDQEQEVKPAKGLENDPETIRMAQAANILWQHVNKLITPQYRIQVCREYLTYGNLYIRISYNKYGQIVDLRALPTKTIKVNSDQNLAFYKDQPDCYIQYPRSNYSEPTGFWPESSIIAIQNIQFQSDRYGMPFILPCLGYARGLIRGTAIIPDAREAGQPIVHENHQDAVGNKVFKNEIAEARWYSLEERKNRNEAINAYRHNITNGTVKIEMLSANGDFWNQLNDFNFFARGITSIFNRTYAKQVGSEVINRATLDRITENDYEGEYRLALFFAQLHDGELLTRQIELANYAVAQINKEYGLEPGKLFIDPEKVKLVTKIKGRKLPERLLSDVQIASDLCERRQLSKRRVLTVASELLDFDVTEEIKWMEEEGKFLTPQPQMVDPNQLNGTNQPNPLQLEAPKQDKIESDKPSFNMPLSNKMQKEFSDQEIDKVVQKLLSELNINKNT